MPAVFKAGRVDRDDRQLRILGKMCSKAKSEPSVNWLHPGTEKPQQRQIRTFKKSAGKLDIVVVQGGGPWGQIIRSNISVSGQFNPIWASVHGIFWIIGRRSSNRAEFQPTGWPAAAVRFAYQLFRTGPHDLRVGMYTVLHPELPAADLINWSYAGSESHLDFPAAGNISPFNQSRNAKKFRARMRLPSVRLDRAGELPQKLTSNQLRHIKFRNNVIVDRFSRWTPPVEMSLQMQVRNLNCL